MDQIISLQLWPGVRFHSLRPHATNACNCVSGPFSEREKLLIKPLSDGLLEDLLLLFLG